jgi:hypothetical protein
MGQVVAYNGGGLELAQRYLHGVAVDQALAQDDGKRRSAGTL